MRLMITTIVVFLVVSCGPVSESENGSDNSNQPDSSGPIPSVLELNSIQLSSPSGVVSSSNIQALVDFGREHEFSNFWQYLSDAVDISDDFIDSNSAINCSSGAGSVASISIDNTAISSIETFSSTEVNYTNCQLDIGLANGSASSEIILRGNTGSNDGLFIKYSATDFTFSNSTSTDFSNFTVDGSYLNTGTDNPSVQMTSFLFSFSSPSEFGNGTFNISTSMPITHQGNDAASGAWTIQGADDTFVSFSIDETDVVTVFGTGGYSEEFEFL